MKENMHGLTLNMDLFTTTSPVLNQMNRGESHGSDWKQRTASSPV